MALSNACDFLKTYTYCSLGNRKKKRLKKRKKYNESLVIIETYIFQQIEEAE
jgi:hypothetical protein